jgi:hypothetical protein
VSNFSSCLSAFVAETQSIKTTKLCETNPISEKSKMNLTYYMTKDYGNNSPLLTMAKQTQSNPILFASGGFKRHICSVLGLKSGVAVGKNEKRYLRLPEEDFQGGEV